MKQVHSPRLNINANTLFLVGAGPGAVDLITVRGAKLLAEADVVFFDALVENAMLALCPQAETIAVGKRGGKPSVAQVSINEQLINAVLKTNSQGKANMVVRLKGGDPMMFGRADEEIQALEMLGVNVQVVPGITSALAASATLKKSLTLRGVARSVLFCTFSTAAGQTKYDWQNMPHADTMAIYMGRSGAVSMARAMLAENPAELPVRWQPDTPVTIIEAVSTPSERHITFSLQEIAAGVASNWFNTESPALLIIGEAMRPKRQRAWLNSPHWNRQTLDYLLKQFNAKTRPLLVSAGVDQQNSVLVE